MKADEPEAAEPSAEDSTPALLRETAYWSGLAAQKLQAGAADEALRAAVAGRFVLLEAINRLETEKQEREAIRQSKRRL